MLFNIEDSESTLQPSLMLTVHDHTETQGEITKGTKKEVQM